MLDITQQELKATLHYDKLTGEFSRLKRKGKVGGVCKGYLRIKIKNKVVHAHRLAWLYVHGEVPNIIDHIDGNKLNNSISNLRNVNNSVNGKNSKLSAANKSGVCGVRFKSGSGKWVATAWADGKSVHLKITSDFFDAVCARKSYESKNGFTQTHGMR